MSTRSGRVLGGQLDAVLAGRRLERAIPGRRAGRRGRASCSSRCPRRRGSARRPWLRRPRRQREHERAPLAELAVDPDPAAVQLDEPLREREAEAGSLPLLDRRPRSAGTPRRSARDPRRRCRDRCRRPRPAPRRSTRAALTSTAPPSGVNFTAFESRLKITCRIRRSSPSTTSTSGSAASASRTPSFDRPLAHHHDAALERLAQRERRDLELDLPRLDLREVEDVVDEREQVVARREDVVEVLLLLLVDLAEHLLAQHLREAEDRVQRRPQLVRHVGEELATCAGWPPRARCRDA